MATSSEIFAAQMAQGGGVEAQLQLGREALQRQQIAQQRDIEQQRLAQAMRLAEMDRAMEEQRIAQQAQQFGMGQALDREQMAQQAQQFGMGFGLREQEAAREQALFDYEQAQREAERGGAAAGFGAFGQMAGAEGKIAELASSPFMRALEGWAGDDPQKQAVAMDLATDQLQRMIDVDRAEGVGAGGTTAFLFNKYKEQFVAEHGRDPDPDEAQLMATVARQPLPGGMIPNFNLRGTPPSVAPDTGGIPLAGGGVGPMAGVGMPTPEGIVRTYPEGTEPGGVMDITAGALAQRAKGEQEVKEEVKLGYVSKNIMETSRAESEKNYTEFIGGAPELDDMVMQLVGLAQIAEYNLAGRALNEATKQFGLEDIKDSADAKAKYNTLIRANLLPKLKPLLGSQFTKVEGDWLLSTLGDDTMRPSEKIAAIEGRVDGWAAQARTDARIAGLDIPEYESVFPRFYGRPGARPSPAAPSLNAVPEDIQKILGQY
jgi:hypothetical protein